MCRKQCIGSESALILVGWIRIQEGNNDTQKLAKVREISCFEVLDVLFRGMKASPVAWTSFTEA
jgi:hypothetical protein